MPCTRFFRTILVIALFSVLPVRSQFYAPDTEYHDKAQRLYVVELARALAWRENFTNPVIAEVKYSVSINPQRETLWDIQWLDKAGAKLRDAKVSYPEQQLVQGPEFYRSVFKQLWTSGKWKPLPKMSADEAVLRFWKGAGEVGVSREASLRRLFAITRSGEWKSGEPPVPEMAGLLSQTPIPSMSGGVTLDAILLARASAWLSITEAMVGTSDKRFDAAWAPVVFMAGRENEALALWKGAAPPTKPDNAHTPKGWWDFLLRSPSTKEAYLFAADSENRPISMAILCYYSRTHGVDAPLAELFAPLYADTDAVQSLHNYGPYLELVSVGGGRLFDGAWAPWARADWLKTMQVFRPGPGDFDGYRQQIESLTEGDLAPDDATQDYSLVGLRKFEPVLRLGYAEAEGKLIPAGSVTARELLQYGWEMNGVQMGAWHYFAEFMWGVHDTAATVMRESTRNIPGQAPFFRSDYQTRAADFQKNLYRIQMIERMGRRVAANDHAYGDASNDPVQAPLFYKRCWLRSFDIAWQIEVLMRAGLNAEVSPYAQRLRAEGGASINVKLYNNLTDDFTLQQMRQIPGLAEEWTNVVASLPTPLNALYGGWTDLSPGKRAVETEKVFWSYPELELEQTVFRNYVFAAANDSARRFYLQSRMVATHDVAFGNGIGQDGWMLGYLMQDEQLMRAALEDSNSGSGVAMNTAVWDFTAHGKISEAIAQCDEMIERYETGAGSNSTGKRMKGMLELIPALKDPKHTAHDKALDYYGKSGSARVLRWILIKQCNLSRAEAIRYMGGEETEVSSSVIIRYLKGDKAGMRQALEAHDKNPVGTAADILAHYLAHELLGDKPAFEQTDLKPAGATSLRDAVLKRIAETHTK